MTSTLRLDYVAPPAAGAFMARAFLPSSGFDAAHGVPDIQARLTSYRIPTEQLDSFHALTGLNARDGLSVLAPHVFGFRLLMTVLTHPTFPLPIWNTLQIRNSLRLHRRIAPDAVLDFFTGVSGWRVLDKGIEIDFTTTVNDVAGLAWESVNTFYYRGRFGKAAPAPAQTPSPEVDANEVASWVMDKRIGWRFGKLSGDYNGIHTWGWYARRFGFRDAFHHPQVVIGQALAKLGDAGSVRTLDTWLKGPVYYGERVKLFASQLTDELRFAVVPTSDPRPAIVARISG